MWAFIVLLLLSGVTITYVIKADAINTQASSYVAADTDAVSFMAYRKAVVDYLEANPSASGNIGSVKHYYLPGFINKNEGNYRAIYQNKKLFVYSLKNIDAQVLSNRFHRSLVVGHNLDGKLRSLEGRITNINIPSEIPSNAVVVVGK